uniref:Probable Brix domain-containing ribosomal biogenesis protein n=1 Tax=Staphylothermus marinus TaxID=2280 RepID=A0A7J3KG41_STAMA
MCVGHHGSTHSSPSSRDYILILVTTSREPSRRTRSFIKELSQTLPYTRVFNRGKRTLVEIARLAAGHNAKFVMIVYEWKANPRRILLYRLNPLLVSSSIDTDQIYRIFASLTISGVKLARESSIGCRIYNPRTIGFSIDKCSSELCFRASEIFLRIYKYYSSREPDVILDFSDNESSTTITVLDGLGRVCGPLIKVVKAEVFE